MFLKKIIYCLIIALLLFSCSEYKGNNDLNKEKINSNLTKIVNENIKIESLNYINLKSESLNMTSIIKNLNKDWSNKKERKTHLNFIVINKDVPNLFRASLKTKKNISYLIKVNHLKNESQVMYGQKIYY